jgi:hypothetical protein
MVFEAAPAPPPPPPAENLVANSGFEADLTGWNTSGSGTGVLLSREAGGHSGGWAAKLANTGTTAASCTLNDSPNVIRTTEAATYTATLWVRAPTTGQTLRLRWREYTNFYGSPNNIAGGVLVGSQTASITLTTTWQEVAVSYTPATAGTVLDLNAYVPGAAPGTCFLADDVVIGKT